MAQRGSYAKGVAKREEILESALRVLAREGYRGTSVKELADAVGLSQAGLLHYFGSKEELFVEIVRKRDETDGARLEPAGPAHEDTLREDTLREDTLREGYLGMVRRNSEVPGLVQLFARVSVDAADHEHPGHEYFAERYENIQAALAVDVRARQAAGTVTDRVDADTLVQLLHAVTDGMQIQWMLNPEIDMVAAVDAFFELLVAPTKP